MKHRVSALFFCAAVSGSLALVACNDDEVVVDAKVDGGADAASPTDAAKPDAASPADAGTPDAPPPPIDAAPPPQDATPPRNDGAADSGIDTGPSTNDAGLDASTADAAARDANATDASDGGTADAALTCLPSGAITVVNSGASAYLVNGVANAALTLCRGNVYTFTILASGHPFYIKTARSTGVANAYSDGVANNGIELGTLTFTVPASAPASLFYDCSLHLGMWGPITVIGP